MKLQKYLVALGVTLAISACSSTSTGSSESALVRNLALEEENATMAIFSMCKGQRLAGWRQSRSFEEGENLINVKVEKRSSYYIPSTVNQPKRRYKDTQVGYVEMNVNLTKGGEYNFIREEIDGKSNQIFIGLKNAQTGEFVSERKLVELSKPSLSARTQEKEMCRSTAV